MLGLMIDWILMLIVTTVRIAVLTILYLSICNTLAFKTEYDMKSTISTISLGVLFLFIA